MSVEPATEAHVYTYQVLTGGGDSFSLMATLMDHISYFFIYTYIINLVDDCHDYINDSDLSLIELYIIAQFIRYQIQPVAHFSAAP